MKTIHVVAAIICDEDRIFATQRGYGEWKDYWEFPGGKIEPGETPEEALHREILEELDAEISVGEKITTVEYDYPTFHLTNTLEQIMKAGSPKECKKLGRSVTPFDSVIWDTKCYDIMKTGNRQKFIQNPGLMRKLLSTGDAILAVA